MNTLIEDIKDKQNINEDEAYKSFWKEVRDSYPNEYDKILSDFNGDFEKALENGALDDLRLNFVDRLDYECKELNEEDKEI